MLTCMAMSGVIEAAAIEVDAEMTQRIQESAKQGEADGQYALGRMYALGKGIPQDQKMYIELIRMAADRGYAQAQYHLGALYQAPLLDLGPLTRKDTSAPFQEDDKQAVMWYRKAAEQGHSEAQFALSQMYFYGHGIPRSKKQAYAWGRKAAEQGHAQAQRAVSYYLLDADNLIEGYAWLLTASANGDSVSSHMLHEHEQKLNKQELGEAEALAEQYFQEYQPKN